MHVALGSPGPGGGGAGTDPVVLRKYGGDGSAEVEALLGDKILDLMLYWRLMRQYGSKNEGRLTQLRGVYVSNETLAAIGEQFVVPEYMAYHAWEAASIHEKGTAVEAIIGKSFISNNVENRELNHTNISRDTTRVAYKIIDAIEASVKKSASVNSNAGYNMYADAQIEIPKTPTLSNHSFGHKNPASALFEWLQLVLKMNKPADAVTISQSSGIESGVNTEPKFVATFELPKGVCYPAHIYGTDVVLRSDPCSNKKRARDNVCRLAIRHFEIDSSLTLSLGSPTAPSTHIVSAEKPMLPLERPSVAYLYEWLQAQGVTYPTTTIHVQNVMSDEDVTRESSFQGVFTMPNKEPPLIIKSDKFANKKMAKEDVASKVLSYFGVELGKPVSSKRPRYSCTSISRAANFRQAFSTQTSTVNFSGRQFEIHDEGFGDTRRLKDGAIAGNYFQGSDATCGPLNGSEHMPPISSSPIEHTVIERTSTVDSSGNAHMSETLHDSTKTGSDSSPTARAFTSPKNELTTTDQIVNSPQILRSVRPASSHCDESIYLTEPMCCTDSLEAVSQYLRQQDVFVDTIHLRRLITNKLMDPNGPMPSIPGLLEFEAHTPWDSSPLRTWFLMSLKFWRCRVVSKENMSQQDTLVLAGFWDSNITPIFSMGAGLDAGKACKEAYVSAFDDEGGILSIR